MNNTNGLIDIILHSLFIIQLFLISNIFFDPILIRISLIHINSLIVILLIMASSVLPDMQEIERQLQQRQQQRESAQQQRVALYQAVGNEIVALDSGRLAIAVVVGKKLNMINEKLKKYKDEDNLKAWLDKYTGGRVSKSTAYDYMKLSKNIKLLKQRFGDKLQGGITEALTVCKSQLAIEIKDANTTLACYADKQWVATQERIAKEQAYTAMKNADDREDAKEKTKNKIDNAYQNIKNGIEAQLGLLAQDTSIPPQTLISLKNAAQVITSGIETLAIQSKRSFEAVEPNNTKLKGMTAYTLLVCSEFTFLQCVCVFDILFTIELISSNAASVAATNNSSKVSTRENSLEQDEEKADVLVEDDDLTEEETETQPSLGVTMARTFRKWVGLPPSERAPNTGGRSYCKNENCGEPDNKWYGHQVVDGDCPQCQNEV